MAATHNSKSIILGFVVVFYPLRARLVDQCAWWPDCSCCVEASLGIWLTPPPHFSSAVLLVISAKTGERVTLKWSCTHTSFRVNCWLVGLGGTLNECLLKIESLWYSFTMAFKHFAYWEQQKNVDFTETGNRPSSFGTHLALLDLFQRFCPRNPTVWEKGRDTWSYGMS